MFQALCGLIRSTLLPVQPRLLSRAPTLTPQGQPCPRGMRMRSRVLGPRWKRGAHGGSTFQTHLSPSAANSQATTRGAGQEAHCGQCPWPRPEPRAPPPSREGAVGQKTVPPRASSYGGSGSLRQHSWGGLQHPPSSPHTPTEATRRQQVAQPQALAATLERRALAGHEKGQRAGTLQARRSLSPLLHGCF